MACIGYYINLHCTLIIGDPVSMDLDRQREWDEAVRLHFYNDESELLLHGEWFPAVSQHRYTILCSVSMVPVGAY